MCQRVEKERTTTLLLKIKGSFASSLAADFHLFLSVSVPLMNREKFTAVTRFRTQALSLQSSKKTQSQHIHQLKIQRTEKDPGHQH